VVVCVNEQKNVRVHLVVSGDAKVNSYADLKGKVVAQARKNREYCRLYFERRCTPPGVAPEKFYRKQLLLAYPEQTLDAIVAGRAHAAVVDVVAWEQYRKDRPAKARGLRSLQVSEPFPPGVIACYKGNLSEADVRSFRTALINARSSGAGRETLQLFRLTTFEEPPEDYDEALDVIARVYPPPAGRK